MFRLLRNKKGFTLIELMIVVAIIAILAAIAIPNFLNYRYKARTAEAKSNIGSINTLEEAYAAETDNYILAEDYPAATGAGITAGTGAPWTAGAYIEGIGFRPKGSVYYSYAVGTTAPNSGAGTMTNGADGLDTALVDGNDDIFIMASGNLDGDSNCTDFGVAGCGQFYSTDEDREIKNNDPVEF